VGGVGQEADGQLPVVREGGDAHAEVAAEGYEGDGLEHPGALHVERYAGPGHVRHDEVDERLVVDEVAGRRQRRRWQRVERREQEVHGHGLLVVLAVTFRPGHLGQTVDGPRSTDRERDAHRRDLVAEPVVALVVRSHWYEHLELAALHHLPPGREEVVHAGRNGGQQQVVERDGEVVLGTAELFERLADDDGPTVEAHGGVEGAVGRDRRRGEQAAQCAGVARHDATGL